jgi:formylglycine-generating enzyme required for sulfatase activity
MLASQAALSRPALADWYRRNRERSAQIFALVDAGAYYDRPIPLRHPFAFYEGHLPAFSFLVLNERGVGETPLDRRLEKLFERGIDPSGEGEARKHTRSDWPSKAEIEAFGRSCDERVYNALAHAGFDMQRAYTILEHEPMHHETLIYIVHQLSPDRKGRIAQEHHDTGTARNEFVSVPAGIATLGARRGEIPFGWDNEFDGHEVAVAAFDVQRYPVTNGDYLAFVHEGAKAPQFWKERDGEFFLHGVFEDLPLPLSWPVYVSNDEARAYAQWKGCRLMSEAEYHRAAFGTPSGEERPMPWGGEAPDALHGNFDFERFDPEPVDAHPAGASAWGIDQLVGNGWEWTSTPFAPFEGFKPMPEYPQYSADFFDGKHFVMKGASPVTARELIRRSFRNWFYADYPYMYAKFRLCR